MGSKDVEQFEQCIARLFSLLYCTALQEISMTNEVGFTILRLDGFQIRSLQHLDKAERKFEIILHWIQRLIVKSSKSRVLDVPPGMICRVFQELSNGVKAVHETSNITQYPFPFAYAQVLNIMLIVHLFVTPTVCVWAIGGHWGAASITGITVFVLWSIYFVGRQIEMPFENDATDISVFDLQVEFNKKLTDLLHPLVKSPPEFDVRESRSWAVAVDGASYSLPATGPMQLTCIGMFGDGASSNKVPAPAPAPSPSETSRLVAPQDPDPLVVLEL